MQNSAVTQTYNSFSGVDMIVTFGNATVGEVQGVSYTVTREKAPLYTMGSANPRSFSRGKRGIAGSLIFLVFDRSALLDIANQNPDYEYIAKRDSMTRAQMQKSVGIADRTTLFDATAGTSANAISPNEANSIRDFLGVRSAAPAYHDQLPPFDVTISAANEYGHVCRMVIKNVEIMNAGSGMSIDDITTDESCTFVATEVIPWHAQFNVHGDVRSTATESPSA